MLQPQSLITTACSLGQRLVLGAAFVLPPVGFSSASTIPPVVTQLEGDSSSIAQIEKRDYSQDLARAKRELDVTGRLLAALKVETDPATIDFLDRLAGIFNSAMSAMSSMSIESRDFPRYLRHLADSLQSARADLFAGVSKVSTWIRLSRVVDPATTYAIPERFITRTPARKLSLSQVDLQTAEYLRSPQSPRLV